MALMVGTQLTRADLDALPDDGLRHELIDGAFVMTPAPGMAQQDVIFALARILYAAVEGTDLKVMLAPYDVVLGPNVVQPDLVVTERTAFTERGLHTPPLLVVEVRSMSTAWVDDGRKRTLYEESGIGHYWRVDPVEPAITVCELSHGHYERTMFARGQEALIIRSPFDVELIPSRLVQG
jgi:Uma2 family endonuclease